MKKLSLCTVLLLAGILLSACAAPAPSGDFKSDTGKFTVTIAQPLVESTQTVDTLAGKIDMHMFVAEIGKTTFIVAYSDYSDAVVQKDPQKVLDLAENGAVSNVNGNFLDNKKITLDGNPGYEFLFESTAQTGETITTKAHFFLVGNRLYQVMALANSGEVDLTVIDPFLASFKVLK